MTDHTRTKKIDGDSISIFVVIQVERETVMTPLFISKSLSQEQKLSLVQLLKKYHDVFAWSYEKMPDLDEDLITHELHISIGGRPIKQQVRMFRHEIETQIKEEINMLFNVGFIKPIL